jgi:hypothetical protein
MILKHTMSGALAVAILLNGNTWAAAGTPEACKIYGESAVKDFADTALQPRCKRRENNRWHAIYDRHYNWCLTAADAPVNEERQVRNGFLTRCGGRAKGA